MQRLAIKSKKYRNKCLEYQCLNKDTNAFQNLSTCNLRKELRNMQSLIWCDVKSHAVYFYRIYNSKG